MANLFTRNKKHESLRPKSMNSPSISGANLPRKPGVDMRPNNVLRQGIGAPVPTAGLDSSYGGGMFGVPPAPPMKMRDATQGTLLDPQAPGFWDAITRTPWFTKPPTTEALDAKARAFGERFGRPQQAPPPVADPISLGLTQTDQRYGPVLPPAPAAQQPLPQPQTIPSQSVLAGGLRQPTPTEATPRLWPGGPKSMLVGTSSPEVDAEAARIMEQERDRWNRTVPPSETDQLAALRPQVDAMFGPDGRPITNRDRVVGRQAASRDQAMAALGAPQGAFGLGETTLSRFAGEQPAGQTLAGTQRVGGVERPIWAGGQQPRAMRGREPVDMTDPSVATSASRALQSYNVGGFTPQTAMDTEMASRREATRQSRADRAAGARDKRVARAEGRAAEREQIRQNRMQGGGGPDLLSYLAMTRPEAAAQLAIEMYGSNARLMGQGMEIGAMRPESEARAGLTEEQRKGLKAERKMMGDPAFRIDSRIKDLTDQQTAAMQAGNDAGAQRIQRQIKELERQRQALRPDAVGAAPTGSPSRSPEGLADTQAAGQAAGLDFDIVNADADTLAGAIIEKLKPPKAGGIQEEMTDEQLDLISGELLGRERRDTSRGSGGHEGRQNRAIEDTVHAGFPPETRNEMLRAIAKWNGKGKGPVVDGYRLELHTAISDDGPNSWGIFGPRVPNVVQYRWVPATE